MRRIAIIGFGFSGLLLLRHLAGQSHTECEIHVYDDSGSGGLGLAYSTTDPDHLLNVMAGRMSAFPDAPNHLMEWLTANFPERGYTAETYIPRMIYAQYLKSIFGESLHLIRGNSHIVKLLPMRAMRVLPTMEVVGADGMARSYDKIALACGHFGERKLWMDDSRSYLRNPWEAHHADRFWAWFDAQQWSNSSQIVLVGAGLTAVDIIHTLANKDYLGTITMVSRGGELPAVHAPASFTPVDPIFPKNKLPRTAVKWKTEIEHAIAWAKSEGREWRAVVDALRPLTNPIWLTWNKKERLICLREYMPWWNRVRHRMPASSKHLIDAWITTGKLRVRPGQLNQTLVDSALAVINTTGYTYDVNDTAEDHLLRVMVKDGLIQPSEVGIGLKVDADGKAGKDIYALGPLRFGSLMETTAVPELRVQSQALAKVLLS